MWTAALKTVMKSRIMHDSLVSCMQPCCKPDTSELAVGRFPHIMDCVCSNSPGVLNSSSPHGADLHNHSCVFRLTITHSLTKRPWLGVEQHC